MTNAQTENKITLTLQEQKVIDTHQSSILWVMDSGYSRVYAETLALRAFPVEQTDVR